MGQTVATLVDSARARHWALTDRAFGDGAAVLYLNARLRTHLAAHGADIEGLVGTSMTYTLATLGTGLLVAETSGVPVYTTTYQDGWPIQLVGGWPTYDATAPKIAGDPFGQNGGTPGFPLPSEMIRLIDVSIVYTGGVVLPVSIIEERARFASQPGRDVLAFVSGNRLVPVFLMTPDSLNSGDRWFNATSLNISYVAAQTLALLTDVANLPSVLTDALIADLAAHMAIQNKDVPAQDKQALVAVASETRKLIAAGGLDMLGSAEDDHVLYRG